MLGSSTILYVNLVCDVKANPWDFYWYINSQKKDNEGIAPLKRREGTGITASETEKAEEFNRQFTDVFNKNDHSEVSILSRPISLMTWLFQMKLGSKYD